MSTICRAAGPPSSPPGALAPQRSERLRRSPRVPLTPDLWAVEDGLGGTPLVLLHGLGGGSSTWAAVAGIVRGDRRVLLPDLLGFGRSPWPDVPYSIEDHLAALERLLAARGLAAGPLELAGHSMGAILAAELAARNADRVQRLTLVSLPYFRSEAEAWAWVAGLGRLARLALVDHWSAAALCGVRCAFRPALSLVAPHFAPCLPPAVVRDALRHSFASYARSLRNVIVRHRPDAALAALADRDVLLVHGDADRLAPVDNVRALVEGFPRWRFEVLREGGHYLPFERQEEVATLLKRQVRFRPWRQVVTGARCHCHRVARLACCA